MTTLTDSARDTEAGTLSNLTRKEIGHYARHPLFLIGTALTALSCLFKPDGTSSSLGNVLIPAAAIGLFGIIVMASLVRNSDRTAEAAGTVATGQRTRTLALAGAVVVPATVGVMWFAWAVWAFHHWPSAANGAPFGGLGDAWTYAVLFDLGVIPCVGGPVLGLVLARWLPRRGAAPIAVVLVVLATILMQGLFESLRTVRLVMPWTQFTGPFGIDSDPDRVIILRGSPQWYGVYLLLLCVLGVLVALLRDDEHPRRQLMTWTVVVAGLAVVSCVLAMVTGVDATMVNPLQSSPT